MLSTESEHGARRSLRSLPASFVQNRKELITYHSGTKKRPRARPVARSHCAGTSLACKRRRAVCCVHCAGAGCRPEGQSPDLTSSKHREVQLTRSAALARAAGKRLRRAADPSGVPGRAAAAGAHDAWPGRARVRSTWLAGRRERRERERGARAVRSRRAPRAAPTRPRHLLSSRGTGPAPRRLVPAGLEPPGGVGRSWPGAFGRTKNKSGARPAHRPRDAARAARGRIAARQICVFEAPATQDWRPLVRTDASTE